MKTYEDYLKEEVELAKSETLKKVFKIIDDFWFSDDKFISVDKLGFLIFKEKEMKEELTQKLKLLASPDTKPSVLHKELETKE